MYANWNPSIDLIILVILALLLLVVGVWMVRSDRKMKTLQKEAYSQVRRDMDDKTQKRINTLREETFMFEDHYIQDDDRDRIEEEYDVHCETHDIYFPTTGFCRPCEDEREENNWGHQDTCPLSPCNCEDYEPLRCNIHGTYFDPELCCPNCYAEWVEEDKKR